MVDHERVMIAEVTICQAIHAPITERIRAIRPMYVSIECLRWFAKGVADEIECGA